MSWLLLTVAPPSQSWAAEETGCQWSNGWYRPSPLTLKHAALLANRKSSFGSKEMRTCFLCGKIGHIKRNCPKRRQANWIRTIAL